MVTHDGPQPELAYAHRTHFGGATDVGSQGDVPVDHILEIRFHVVGDSANLGAIRQLLGANLMIATQIEASLRRLVDL